MDSHSNKNKQKWFQNVVNEPLLSGDPDETVLGIIAIPELHLLIGNAILLFYGKCSHTYRSGG